VLPSAVTILAVVSLFRCHREHSRCVYVCVYMCVCASSLVLMQPLCGENREERMRGGMCVLQLTMKREMTVRCSVLQLTMKREMAGAEVRIYRVTHVHSDTSYIHI